MNNKTTISQQLDKAATTATPIAQPSEAVKFSLEEAYNIQHKLIQLRLDRGETITGYKLGFTSKAKMQQMGVDDLIWGVLTDNMEIKPDENIDLNQYIHPRAEPEVAFRISNDIAQEITLNDIPQYIDKMAVAIEVIDSRYKDFKFSLEDVIADNCSSIGYCIGQWQDLKEDITNLPIQLTFNDKTVQSGFTQAILDNPYQSIVELSRLAAEKNLVLKKGQIILAGAATAAEWLKPKTKVSAELKGFGEVRFNTL
ncbi:2-keto-4-pentenoate hydratase [Mesohalobacter halotolerans]|uniref:4-oxalocrotonate decarboxylase n=1 Tax=Mesohalobacter halotolerans TaxID=1883405 RepID=A0A4U5TNP9_9FLAO|nr:fumarylacetoacetate hydrolase family protein [Mesohalobacter halotolerans]MBS3739407.1 fumarylacetoacetate hydrolase family protein [Psychroflexus sp.]TKS55669.1 4-oxalocrotonate decarboxylase [Mesohalobacter halotolerans]